jgi:hypothetical protein
VDAATAVAWLAAVACVMRTWAVDAELGHPDVAPTNVHGLADIAVVCAVVACAAACATPRWLAPTAVVAACGSVLTGLAWWREHDAADGVDARVLVMGFVVTAVCVAVAGVHARSQPRQAAALVAIVGAKTVPVAMGWGRDRVVREVDEGGYGYSELVLDARWPLVLLALAVLTAATLALLRGVRVRTAWWLAVPWALTVVALASRLVIVTKTGEWSDGRPARTGRSRRRVAVGPARGARSIAEHHLCAARHEHASITSFLVLAGELTALGAPAALVARCRDAARDEADHTARCRRLAGDDGPAWSAGLVPAPRLPRSRSAAVARLGAEALVDGCVGEGAAAARLRAAANDADPAVARVLLAIAADEDRHRDLAADIVRWAVGEEPCLARRALAAARRGVAAAPRPRRSLADPAGERRAGVPDPALDSVCWREALHRADALLAELAVSPWRPAPSRPAPSP